MYFAITFISKFVKVCQGQVFTCILACYRGVHISYSQPLLNTRIIQFTREGPCGSMS